MYGKKKTSYLIISLEMINDQTYLPITILQILFSPTIEYYEQSSLDVQPNKKTKARNFSSEEAPKIVGFWQVPG